jgi:hypothetical protein
MEYTISIRYFINLIPFLFMILSLLFSKIIKKQSKFITIPSTILLLIFFFLGFMNNARIPLREQITPNYHEHDGFSYERFGIEILTRNFRDFNKVIYIGNSINSDFRHQYYFGLGSQTKGYLTSKHNKEFNKMEKLIEGIDERYKSYYYEGVGYGLGKYFTYGGGLKSFQALLDSLKKIKEKNRVYCYIGLSEGIAKNIKLDRKTFLQNNFEKIENEYKKYFYPILGRSILNQESNINPTKKNLIYRGLGPVLYFESNFQSRTFNEMMKSIPEEYRASCLEGVGLLLENFYKRNFHKVQETIEELNSNDKFSAYKGVGRSI